MLTALLVLLGTAAPDYPALMRSMGIPGAQIAVVRHGRVAMNLNLGVKDTATHLVVDSHTRFEIGSITKQFTAAAILQLQERGRLQLDDDLSRYVPEYRYAHGITLRELLLQTSGIPNYTETDAFRKFFHIGTDELDITQRGNLQAVLNILNSQALEFTPGTGVSYSNSGYFLLGRVIEIASGMPWQSFIRENIFVPAGMRDSGFSDDEARAPNRAEGYTKIGNVTMRAGSMKGWEGAAGGIVSTAGDLAKWDTALFSGKIILKNDLRVMLTPGPLPAVGSGHFAMGWVVDQFDEQDRLWHNGGSVGFASNNQYYPRLDEAIIVLVNSSGNGDQLASREFEALHPEIVASLNRSIAGEDARVTRTGQRLWQSIITGQMGSLQLEAPLIKRLTPDLVAALRGRFNSLGTPKSFFYRGTAQNGSQKTYRYRLVFSDGGSLNLTMTIDAAGAIANFNVVPN